jgi:hypothetical protein
MPAMITSWILPSGAPFDVLLRQLAVFLAKGRARVRASDVVCERRPRLWQPRRPVRAAPPPRSHNRLRSSFSRARRARAWHAALFTLMSVTSHPHRSPAVGSAQEALSSGDFRRRARRTLTCYSSAALSAGGLLRRARRTSDEVAIRRDR